MKPAHVLHVVGERPNFMQVAPVLNALGQRRVKQTFVHTGYPYDVDMSDAIFRELQIPQPDVNLGIESTSHAEQTAQVMIGVERCVRERRPDLLLVYGDVDSAMAATVAASKIGVPVGHVEAGLRSHDMTLPEEVNRVVTDRLASWHFTTAAHADKNLLAEGVHPSSIKFVGNVLIDTLVRLLPLTQPRPILEMLGLMNGAGPKPFALVTLHRANNVEDDATLEQILDTLADIAADIPVIFPVRPRTRARMKDHQLQFSGLLVTQPLSYLQFLGLQQHARFVVTDSAGIQDETTYLGVPCLTMRKDTERRVTVDVGSNHLVGHDMACLKEHVSHVLSGRAKRGAVPPLWDGRSAERIADEILGRQ